MCKKFECREDIHYKTQLTGDQLRKMQLQSLPPLGIEPASSGLLDQISTTELQKLIRPVLLLFTGSTISLMYILNSRPSCRQRFP